MSVMRELDFKLSCHSPGLRASAGSFYFRIKKMGPGTRCCAIITGYGDPIYNEFETLYQALDACNDWWFHAQRGMLDVNNDIQTT